MSKKALTILGIIIVMVIVFLITTQQIKNHDQPSSQTGEKEKIDVLAILPLTGGAASFGEYVKNGFELYKQDHPDTSINLTIEDSQGDPKTGVNVLTQRLAVERPDVVITTLSNVSGAVIPKTENEKIFTVVTLSSSDKILEDKTYVQRINVSTVDIVKPLALYAKENFEKVAIIYSNGQFGLANKNTFELFFVDEEHSIISAEEYALSETDVRAVTEKAVKNQPEAVFVTGYGSGFTKIFSVLKEWDFQGQILSGTTLANPAYNEVLGDTIEQTIFVATDLEFSEPQNLMAKDFKRRYQQKFEKVVFFNTAFAYDILSIIEELNRQSLLFSQESLQQLGSWQGITSQIEFLPGGECRIPLRLIKRENGKNVAVEGY